MAIGARDGGQWKTMQAGTAVQQGGAWKGLRYLFAADGTRTVYPDDPDYPHEIDDPSPLPPKEVTIWKVARAFEPPTKTPAIPTISRRSADPSWVDDGSPRPPDYVRVDFGPHAGVNDVERGWSRQLILSVGGGQTVVDPLQTYYEVLWSGISGNVSARMRYVNDAGEGPLSGVSATIWVWGIDPL